MEEDTELFLGLFIRGSTPPSPYKDGDMLGAFSPLVKGGCGLVGVSKSRLGKPERKLEVEDGELGI